MSTEGSVTGWIGQVQAGDPAAVQKLWERYFPRLVGLARRKLRGSARGPADEEDVALSAFNSFCRNAEQGRFPELADREGLWRLLVVITARKAQHLLRDEARQKRGGGSPPARDDSEDPLGVDQILGREPSPDFAAQMAEEYRRLLQILADRELEAIAVWKMEGFTVEEIADKLGYAPRSIKRKLRLIRSLWEQESDRG
jgi:DNA-directed RNA polymerase specialized sigma24 family protein